MDATEGAVREERDDVAGLRFVREASEDRDHADAEEDALAGVGSDQ